MSDIDKLRKEYEFAVEFERYLLRKSMKAQIEATTQGQRATDIARRLKALEENN